MLLIAALIALAAPPFVAPFEKPDRPGPLDKLDKLIPQPLKADVTVHVDLPVEARQLMADLHGDRRGIAMGGCVVLSCLTLATAFLGLGVMRYVVGWFRRG